MTTAVKTAASWESNDTSHRALLRAAGDFNADSFRQKTADKGVVMLLGKHNSNDSVLQVHMMVFDRDVFATQGDAKMWLKDHEDVDKEYDSRTGTKLDGKSITTLGISKNITMLQSAGEAEKGALGGGVTAPSDEQLRLINTFTRSPKTKSEVAVFPILAANDIIDRDQDRFPPECLQGFMDLKGPLSPIGKSFMVGHSYTSLPVGRIFDGGIEVLDEVTWLKLFTYMPNTPQYQAYLENVDFGIYWAVSVGVMLGAATCSVGTEHAWGWHPYVCSAGHMKGERYEADASGDMYDMPPTSENGELCWRNLVEPQDFYELSQVYLGAQYMAALSDKLAVGAAKSFAKGGVDMAKGLELYESDAKIITLTADEAHDLPRPGHFPEGSRVAQAHAAGLKIEESDDGSLKWTDSQKLLWVRDVAGEETCLGLSAEQEPSEDDKKGAAKKHAYQEDGTGHCVECGQTEEQHGQMSATANREELLAHIHDLNRKTGKVKGTKDTRKDTGDNSPEEIIAAIDAIIDNAIVAMDDEDYATADSLLTGADELIDELMDAMGIEDPDEDDSGEDDPTMDNRMTPGEEGEVPKEAVLAAVRTAKLPASVVEAVAASKGTGLEPALVAASKLISDLETKVAGLTAKAAIGDQYVQECKAEAIHWFTMQARDPGSTTGVNVDKIERMLDLCGDNVELIKEQRELYRDLARAKFPEAVRRSSFPDNSANERNEMAQPTQPGETGASRIHG